MKVSKAIYVILEEVVVSGLLGRFTRTDVKAAYHYCSEPPEFFAASLESSVASSAQFVLEVVYGRIVDDDWKVDVHDGGIAASSRLKTFRSKFDR